MSRHAASPRRDERGAATAFAATAVGALLLLGSVLGVVAAVVVDLRTAQAAADLAALAGAGAAGRGGDACTDAGLVARANGARLVACSTGPDPRDVLVEVEVGGPRWLGLSADPRATARAGPVTTG